MTSIHSANMAASTTPIASTTSSTSTSSSSVQVNLEAEVTQLMQDQAEARNMGVASQLARQKRLELLKLEAELRNGSISADEFHVRFAEIKNGA